MSTKTYTEFITDTSSEKITLAHIHCKWRAFTFTTYSGNIQQKTMDHVVVEVLQDETECTAVASRDLVVADTFFFDMATNILYVYSTDIANSEVIVTFRLFFANAPVSLSYDMTDSGEEVYYEPRIEKTSNIEVKVSEEKKGLALIGNSKISLIASDGYFDDIFEKYVWDNKDVVIYSYNREILASEAKVIYRGYISNRSYNKDNVDFSLKDFLRNLDKDVSSYKFTEYIETAIFVTEAEGSGLNEDYILFSTPSTEYHVWFNVAGEGSDPSPGSSTDIRVNLSGGETAIQVADAIRTKLNTNYSNIFTVDTAGSATLNITNIEAGNSLSLPTVGNTGWSTAATSSSTGDKVYGDIINKTKRRVFGKIDGIQLQSIDMMGLQLVLTGHVSGTSGSTAITGVGTSFLAEATPGDLLQLNGSAYEIETITDDTNLVLKDELSFSYLNAKGKLQLDQPYQGYNRKYLISPKELNEFDMTITSVFTTLRVNVDDVKNLKAGDTVVFNTTPSQERTVNRVIADQNQIIVTQALSSVDIVGDTITRPPIQKVYYDKKPVVNTSDTTLYTITNNSVDGCYLIFTDTFERDFVGNGVSFNSPSTYSKVAGSRVLTFDPLTTPENTDIKPRDWVQIGNSAFMEVLSVADDGDITLRTNDGNTYTNQSVEIKRTTMIGDDSVIVANIYGEDDGTGELIETSAQMFKTLLVESGYSSLLNNDSFTQANNTEYALLSVASPINLGDETETLKKLFIRVNNSVNSVLSVDDELKLKYLVFDGSIDYDNLITINEQDVIKWSKSLTTPPLYSTINTKYRFEDLDYISESKVNQLYIYSNEFVSKYVGVQKTKDNNSYLYKELDVLNYTSRQGFMSTQTSSVFKITSDLRYQNLEIGQVVQLGFLDLKTLSTDSTKKIGFILAITKSDNKIEFVVSDLGNIYNRRAVITPDTAPDYDASTEDEKLLYSYITDDNGLSDEDEETHGGNLII